jgi:hypothetical protein
MMKLREDQSKERLVINKLHFFENKVIQYVDLSG